MSALDDYRREAAERLDALDSELASLRLARADANADDEHDPEGSTLSSDWSRLAGLRAEALAQLERADAVLARVDAGTYGTCVTCGRAIPAERLAVRPAASQCVACVGGAAFPLIRRRRRRGAASPAVRRQPERGR